MRSTGEVMGIAASFPEAFLKAQLGTGVALPDGGTVFISVRDDDKPAASELGIASRSLASPSWRPAARRRPSSASGVEARDVNKVTQGHPHTVDALRDGEIAMVINTTEGAKSIRDSNSLRRADAARRHPLLHHHRGGYRGGRRRSKHVAKAPLTVRPLQEYHAELGPR